MILPTNSWQTSILKTSGKINAYKDKQNRHSEKWGYLSEKSIKPALSK